MAVNQMFQSQLKEQQPVVYKTLYNSLKNNKVAQAYLFSGPAGTPKKETAFLLAQSLLCAEKEDVFACEQCERCQRIQKNEYADMIYLNGKNESIKVDTIRDLISSFSKTGLEAQAQKIYIIDYAENCTVAALNALLKFLEEPISGSVNAILITEHAERLLPTIISRCQTIQFKALSKDICYNNCVENGMDPLDAYLLSNMIRDTGAISKVADEESYQTARQLFKVFIEELLDNKDTAIAHVTTDNAFKSKKAGFPKAVANYFVSIGRIFFADCSREIFYDIPWYKNMLEKHRGNKYDNENVLQAFNQAKDRLLPQAVYNVTLVMDQLFYQM